jgi:DNA polymerase/3'-5' exonuclease PolX
VEQEAHPFRVRAWRNAAGAIHNLPISVEQIHQDEGIAGLERMRSIGPGIAGAIQDLLVLGSLPMLERLRGEGDPVALLASVPGIGKALAERLHHERASAASRSWSSRRMTGGSMRLPGSAPSASRASAPSSRPG